jgi:uncharacterized membrane protein
VASEAQGAPGARPVPKPGGDHHSPFGNDTFGVQAERFARFFGTPTFILSQTAVVLLWITLNALEVTKTVAWDPYPFIALNLAFSLQAAYAAPLILLAQTRQADRDKIRDEKLQEHREAENTRLEGYEQRQAELLSQDKTMAEQHSRMLAQNTELTEQVAKLTADLHTALVKKHPGA